MTHFDLFETRADGARPIQPGLYPKFGKRLLDVLICLLLLPVLVPVIALLWAAKRLQGGPGFFAHARIGQHGIPFRCYKICTMYPDSDRILKDHLNVNPGAAEEWARNRKLRRDPRITPFGSLLRRTSLDELPQVLNVLRGDMSLVGPRPVTEDELSYYAPMVSTYLKQKPGITGPWQVNGRTDGCYRARVRMDRSYLDRVSLRTDLGLIFLTGLTVIRPSGS